MVATQGSIAQSTFRGVDLVLRPGPGGPTAAQAGGPPAGTIVSSVPAQQAGAGPVTQTGGIYNLSEAAGGFSTTIQGKPVQVAYPFS